MEPIIHFNPTSLVKPSTHPANGSLQRRIDFTPLDLQLLPVNYFQFGLLYNKPTPKQLEEELIGNSVINHLKDSLSRTLGIFTLSCRHRTPRQDKGAEFIEAVAPGVTVAQILEPTYVPEVVYSLLPMEGVRNFEGISKPLLAVQVTELVDGLFVGIAINHSVADGTAFWHFVNTWSEISKNHYLVQDIIVDKVEEPSNSALGEVKIFHFSKKSIAAVKAKANAQFGSCSASNISISSLQATIAHFWRSITRVKLLEVEEEEEEEKEETHCKISVNVRHRLRPPLPDKYLRNAVVVGSTTATAGELLEHGLGWTALQVNKMIARQTDEEIKKNLKAWVERPQAPKLGQPGSNMGGLDVGGSPWFNVYGNDFGWGKGPITVRGGLEKLLDCTIFSHPGGEEDGSVDIHACLDPQILLALENDTEFMTALST
ncbi:hypothetical protein Tsubulata_011214, partial [Turnera subulata]